MIEVDDTIILCILSSVFFYGSFEQSREFGFKEIFCRITFISNHKSCVGRKSLSEKCESAVVPLVV